MLTISAQSVDPGDRVARLLNLDKIYRSQGVDAWLAAAGIKCDVGVEARQPEEEVVIDAQGAHVVVSGVQIKGKCESIPWPVILTTDRPNEVVRASQTRQYQPDLRNPSVIYTNVGLSGQGTIWVDGSNWGQLKPEGQASSANASAPEQVLVTRYVTQTVEGSGATQANPYLRFPWEWLLGVATILVLVLLVLALARAIFRRSPTQVTNPKPKVEPKSVPQVAPTSGKDIFKDVEPAAKPVAVPDVSHAAKPVAKSEKKPAAKPAAKPVAKPDGAPAVSPTTKP